MVSINRIALCLVFFTATGAARPNSASRATKPQAERASAQEGETVTSRVLETWNVKKLGVALAVFHQARKEEGPKLGELLRARDGASVEFRTPDGRWHAATVLRMGTCFGRGLLVFPAASASLVAREIVLLRFPTETGSLPLRAPEQAPHGVESRR